MKYKIPFIRPSFPPSSAIAADYEKIIENNWFTNFGPFEQKFRRESAKFIGENISACTVANATLGLDIAIRSLFKNQDKPNVLVPSFTFAAGPEVILSNGLTPVLIDLNDDIQPDINQAQKYIAENRSTTAGILLCNTFGVGNAEIESWEILAKEYGLPLIIDSAAGFGSEYLNGERVGGRGDCEVFSFHATKPFAIGEGGLITSKNETFIQKCREMQNFGFNTNREIEHIGTNAKMQEINGAIGLRQLGGFVARVVNRRESLGYLKEEMIDTGYTFQDNDDFSTVAFATVVAPTSETADKSFARLHEGGVEVRRYYNPVHLQPKLARLSIAATGGLEVTENIASKVLSLPIHDSMDSEDIGYISRVIKASRS